MLTVFTVDAEKAAIDYLMPLLAASDDWADVDIDIRGGSGRFVRVRRVGGVDMTPAHDRASLDFLVWHDDDDTRMALGLQLWAWMRGAANETTTAAVLTYQGTILGPRRMPDPADDTKEVVMFTVAVSVHALFDQ